jgi:hypothetical protein
MAPTLADFWRSDVRRPPERKAPTWAGWTAFAVGIVSMVTLYLGAATDNRVLVSLSLPFSLTAGFFALVALIAGIGRLPGFLGLIFALAGNVFVIGWLGQLFT